MSATTKRAKEAGWSTTKYGNRIDNKTSSPTQYHMKTIINAIEQQKRPQPQAICVTCRHETHPFLQQLFSVVIELKIEKKSPEKQYNTNPYLFKTTMDMYQCDLACWHGAVATLPSTRRRRESFTRVGAFMAFSLILTKQNPPNIHLMPCSYSVGEMMA